MYLRPNTTVTLTRGTTTTAFGSPQPSTTPLYQGIPITIASTTTQVASQETGRTYEVSEVFGSVDRTLDVREGDRLRDEHDGTVYEVRAVTTPVAYVGWSHLPTYLMLRTVES